MKQGGIFGKGSLSGMTSGGVFGKKSVSGLGCSCRGVGADPEQSDAEEVGADPEQSDAEEVPVDSPSPDVTTTTLATPKEEVTPTDTPSPDVTKETLAPFTASRLLAEQAAQQAALAPKLTTPAILGVLAGVGVLVYLATKPAKRVKVNRRRRRSCRCN